MTSTIVGITKIKKIENVGIFSAFAWPSLPSDLLFQKINLIYGCNGSGKTTLSNIIGLFSEDYHVRGDLDKKRIEQGLSSDPSKSIEIEVEWDGRTAKYPADKKNIYVFNSSFVAEHVYDGTQAKVKLFKQVTTKEQLSNPTLKSIDGIIASATLKISDLTAYTSRLEKLFGVIKNALSETWNKNIINKTKMPVLKIENCPEEATPDSEETIQKGLDAEFLKFKASQDGAAIEQAIADLNQMASCSIRLPDDMTNVLVRLITKVAREKVQIKIDTLKDHTMKHGSIQNWFEDGAILLKTKKDDLKCPLCDNELPNIEDILASYDAFFNDELAALKREISAIIMALHGLIAEAEAKCTQALRMEKILSDYSYEDVTDVNLEAALSRLQSQNFKELGTIVKAIFDKKIDDIDFVPSVEHKGLIERFLSEMSQFFADISILVSTKEKVIECLRSTRFDERNAKIICERLFWKRFDHQGKQIVADAQEEQAQKEEKLNIPDNIGGIGLLHFLRNEQQLAQTMLTKKEEERASELAKLKKESEYVNIFLAKLCISNFKINTSENGDVTVHYSGFPPKKGLQYSLSEGEKTALAFAYFLSKYRHEIIDNQKMKQEDCMVVIDDPVSSLDENRLFSTALAIQSELLPRAIESTKDQSGKKIVTKWSGCRQIIILSHNIVFLKFMSNLTDSGQNTSRADLFLDKGCMSFLPASLKNYQTSYFHKLGRIQDYVAGRISHDDVRDSLPNYIRVTLEAFMAFKFARLAGDDKHTPAMLDKLVKHITSDAKAFSGFVAVSDIADAETLKSTLLEIRQKTNPECHGTTQDITHIEYLPESELKRLAEQTLNVIQFLDQIHFNAAQKLMKAVA